MNTDLLSRIEDTSLNASAPPQQRWLDGWLVRFSPGKAKRARCINAVAPGRLPVAEKLRLAQAVFDEAQLPLVVRITPFSQPETLDNYLTGLGMRMLDDTRVMVGPVLSPPAHVKPLPAGCSLERTDAATYASVVGQWRGSPPDQCAAQAQRQALSPVPYEGWLVRRRAPGRALGDGEIVACGQFAREADLVGLYDVFTAPDSRGQGLCAALLAKAAAQGACTAYLQVEASNAAARAVYHRLGFVDGYSYHYRTSDPTAK
jgi:GNAT superfamily N-acetyltransferase